VTAALNLPRPFSPETLGERWGCSAEKVRQMCRSGELTSFRLGKLLRIPASEVERIECQNTDSSSTAANGASLTPSQGEAAFESRLARQTEGLPRLALVSSGGREPDRNPSE
jgi:excisionase family DNA binding protein